MAGNGKFKLNQRIAKILNFITLSIMHLFSRVVVGADPYEMREIPVHGSS